MTRSRVFRRPALTVAAGAAIVAVGAAAYLGLVGLGGGDRSEVSEAALAALGEPVYQEFCASCHGADLEGQPDWRAPLATGGLPAPPHDETGHTWHHPDQQLFEITKFGGQRFAPATFQSNMPAFQDLLDDREIQAVLAYVRSRWPASIRDRQRRITDRAR